MTDGATSSLAAAMPSQQAAHTNQKVGSDIHAITARIQSKVIGKKIQGAPIEDGEGSDEEDTQPPPKKKVQDHKGDDDTSKCKAEASCSNFSGRL